MNRHKPNSGKRLRQRKSIRLKGYDYTQAGWYFITICCQDRVCRFGEISNGEMALNEKGAMIEKWWQKIPDKFPDIALGEYIIMPNHFHAIVINTGIPTTVGTDPCVCPPSLTDDGLGDGNDGQTRGFAPTVGFANPMDEHDGVLDEHDGILGEHDGFAGEHVGSPLHGVVGWFKTMTTNAYIRGVKTLGWERFDGKLWQRNYYERIIRNEQSFETISNYIRNNPAKWDHDKLKRK